MTTYKDKHTVGSCKSELPVKASLLTFANVPTCVFDGGVAVDVGQQAEAKAVLVVGWVCEAIHQDAAGGGVESLPHTVVELIVSHRAPVLGFFITYGS